MKPIVDARFLSDRTSFQNIAQRRPDRAPNVVTTTNQAVACILGRTYLHSAYLYVCSFGGILNLAPFTRGEAVSGRNLRSHSGDQIRRKKPLP